MRRRSGDAEAEGGCGGEAAMQRLKEDAAEKRQWLKEDAAEKRQCRG